MFRTYTVSLLKLFFLYAACLGAGLRNSPFARSEKVTFLKHAPSSRPNIACWLKHRLYYRLSKAWLLKTKKTDSPFPITA